MSIHQENLTIINIYRPKDKAQIHEANTDRIKGRNRQFKILIGQFEHLLP